MDSQTLILALLPVILAGMFIHLVNMAIHRNKEAPGFWLVGTAVHGLGQAMICFRENLPDILGIVVGDILSAGGFLILLEGVARFSGQRLPRWIAGAIATLILVGFPFFTWVVDHAAVRFGVFATAVIGSNLLMLPYLSIIGRRDGQASVRLLRYTIYYFAFSLSAISIGVMIFDPAMPGILEPSQFVSFGLLSMIGVETTLIFGCALLSSGQTASVLRQAALTDHLTGLPNRRAFERQVNSGVQHGEIAEDTAALAVFDIDHFKQVNDTYGHDVGDAVLRHVAQTLTQALRKSDFVARLGGEEFVAVLHDMNGEGFNRIADRVRKAVEENPFELNGRQIRVTVSAGLAPLPDRHPCFTRLFAAADKALYQAKGEGRNRVVMAAAA